MFEVLCHSSFGCKWACSGVCVCVSSLTSWDAVAGAIQYITRRSNFYPRNVQQNKKCSAKVDRNTICEPNYTDRWLGIAGHAPLTFDHDADQKTNTPVLCVE